MSTKIKSSLQLNIYRIMKIKDRDSRVCWSESCDILFSYRLANANSQLNNGKYSHIEVCRRQYIACDTLWQFQAGRFLRFVCIFNIPVYTVNLLVPHEVGLRQGQIIYFQLHFQERDTKLTLKGKSVRRNIRLYGINLTQIIAFLYRGNSVFLWK